MLILVTRSGGVAGIHEELGPVDTAELPEASVAALEVALTKSGFFELPSDLTGGGIFDDFYMTIHITDGDRDHSVSLNSGTEERYRDALQPVVAALVDAGYRFVDWNRDGKLLDWSEASVHSGFVSDFFLSVRGVAAGPMLVRLRPEFVASVVVDYHPVDVVGVPRREGAAQSETPWELTVNTKTIPHGGKGFELVGATLRRRFP